MVHTESPDSCFINICNSPRAHGENIATLVICFFVSCFIVKCAVPEHAHPAGLIAMTATNIIPILIFFI